ncbi:MAG: transcription initiation factor IIB [Candidatus Bathyarchaeota archaeon]|nr:transcription initiation factor IIB [Candidatus Bathyarchaeota archaeon]MDH5687621.1 transcription initiation factor IIB [Candidatus Bathyarchaeota archaeon]
MSEEESNLEEIQRCSSCGSTGLVRDYENSEIVCMHCGFVIAARMADRGPEWRAFNREQREKRARAGAPLTYTVHDKGLSTVIDWQDKDARGKRIDAGQKAQIYRLRKWQRRIRVSDASERNLAFALTEMRKIAGDLSLSRSVFETASIIYRKAVKGRLIRGRSIRGMSAASIYIACRKCGFIRTLEEVAAASSMSKKDIGRSYRFLVKELDYFIPPTKPSQYISKFSNHLAMQGKVEQIASKILRTATELKLTPGRGPAGIAAAATYIASALIGERRTQREVAEIAQVTEVTIRNRYKEINERLLFVMSL